MILLVRRLLSVAAMAGFGLILSAEIATAADLLRVDLVARDRTAQVDFRLNAPTKSTVSISADGLIISVLFPELVGMPAAQPSAAGPIAAVLIDRLSVDKGIRVNLFARQPMRLGQNAAEGKSVPNLVQVILEAVPQAQSRIALTAPPVLNKVTFPRLAWIDVPKPVIAATPTLALALGKPLSPPALAPPALAKPVQPVPAPPSVSVAAEPPVPASAPAPQTVQRPTKLAPRALPRPNPPEGVPATDPRVKAAWAGDEKSAIELGTLCLAHSPPDPVSARGWFELAASRGSAIGNFNLGEMYRRGVGGPLDEVEAVAHYTLSADAGIALARYRLALMLLEGRGTAQDVPRAKGLLELASLQGHTAARRLLDDLNQGMNGPAGARNGAPQP